MNTYRVVVRTIHAAYLRMVPATSAAEAGEFAATEFASVPCGITVKASGVRA